MSTSSIIAIYIYSIGLVGWYIVWYLIVGFKLLQKIKLLYFPFLAAQFVFIMNIWLAIYSIDANYEIELSLYSYVESNGKSVAGMSLAIAVFWGFVSKDEILIKSDILIKLFCGYYCGLFYFQS